MESTGERLLTNNIDQCALEHLHRYAFALQFVANKTVVDIASGEGYGSNILSSEAAYVTGVDVSEEAITHSKHKYLKPNLEFKVGSAERIPVEESSIDVVVSFETIEHHNKHQEMMEEIKRVLKPKGILIISSPDKYNYSIIPEFNNKFHIKELYREEFHELIIKNFTHTVFLNQRLKFSSLLTAVGQREFFEFSGDFNNISKNHELQNPHYNIAIASQEEIKNVFSSSFDGNKVFKDIVDALNSELNGLLNSHSFKLGSFLLRPFSKIKRLFDNH